MKQQLRTLSDFVSQRVLRTASTVAIGFGFLLFGAGHTQTVVANGDTRTLSLVHRHTGEEILVTFKRDGRYDQEALNKLNWFLRDWRNDQPTRMDPGLFDVLWEVYRGVGGQAPINVLSAFRSEGTNAMLRRRSRAVAQHSQHIQGRAMDFFIPGVSMTRVREVGLQLQRGGVGFYPGSANHFIHLDTGSVRHWPKVSRDYLARLFPDGRTVHIPADGRPMAGFETALAMVQARGGTASRFYDSRSDEAGFADEGDRGGVLRQRGGGMGFFAALFGGNQQQAQQPAPARQTFAQRGSGRVSATLRPAEAAPGIPARTEPVAPAAAQTQIAQAQPAQAQPAQAQPAQAQPAQVQPAGGRAGAPVQIAPNPPRMLIAMAPVPARAPSAAERLRAQEEGELMQRLAAGPMPMARPTIPGEPEPQPAATTFASLAPPMPQPVPEAARAPEPNRPTPLAEPAPSGDRIVVAQAPVPASRPQIIGGSAVTAAAVLPALITTGDQRGQSAPAEAAPGFALAFASPSQRVTLPNAAATPQPRTAAPVARSHAGPQPSVAQPAPPVRAPHQTRVARAAPTPMVAPSTTGQRGRVVFVRQTTDREASVATLTTPDPRQLKLIEQPDQMVAMTFSQSNAPTMSTQRFAGQAVATLRTLDFSRPEPVAQRRASLEQR
ncbi:DUF882 domain-containing protein [Phreatobacter stygius]|uniref:DUF882 domain-containing protein n=1 Tax=Phreatobacter stygius TaxID=1940610 RepID=UPI001FE3F33E|nr:DUF882 domain-containing protein [Phreatobacter stygius]